MQDPYGFLRHPRQEAGKQTVRQRVRHWQRAYRQLDSTNNFPELTGRLCPACRHMAER